MKESAFDISTLLRERAREQSQQEPVQVVQSRQYFRVVFGTCCFDFESYWQGEIKVTRSGTLRLTWDNLGAPWRLERRLSYNVSQQAEAIFPFPAFIFQTGPPLLP